MSHKSSRHPFDASPASVRASRNLLYLLNGYAGKIGYPDDTDVARVAALRAVTQSPRFVLEVTNDNIRKANQKDQRQTARAVLQAGQEAANAKWLNGRGANAPARPERRMTPPCSIKAIFKARGFTDTAAGANW